MGRYDELEEAGYNFIGEGMWGRITFLNGKRFVEIRSTMKGSQKYLITLDTITHMQRMINKDTKKSIKEMMKKKEK